MTLRAVIYARYSSDNQSEASIEDQIRLCKELIAHEGWTLIDSFGDAAISGATTTRPSYQALIEAAREAAFDVIVAEGLDRLSRDQEDVAALFKQMRFAGIKIVTLAEGEINELHVGLKGTMNALFLRDLADKTRRGLRGRVVAGQSAGGRAFGYDVVRQLDAAGNPVRGERAINATEAAAVRRIFGRFADGVSPIAIAKTLNDEGVPGPAGHAWRDTTIRGHALRGTGILRNELYIGRLVWNRMTYVRNPATGRRVSRMNPQVQALVMEVPQLRIPGFDDKIISMYARGMSTREIVGHLRELYGLEVSPDLISAVTDAILDEVTTWQGRPCARSCCYEDCPSELGKGGCGCQTFNHQPGAPGGHP
jgi:DNA invertase Pin-like site-specific DNA recombinase